MFDVWVLAFSFGVWYWYERIEEGDPAGGLVLEAVRG